MMLAVGFVLGIFVSALGFLVFRVFAVFFVAKVFFGFVSFFFLFVEGSATNQGVGLGARLGFLVLGLNQAGGKSS